MSQLLSTLDIAMLQENAGVILSLMQQTTDLVNIIKLDFVVTATQNPEMFVDVHYKPTFAPVDRAIENFFKNCLFLDVVLNTYVPMEHKLIYRILSAEVSQVKITATYDICTVQSVLAAAVQEVPHPDGIVRGTSVIGEIDPVMVETVSMPDDDAIGDATAQIAYERFDDETYDTSASEVGRSSVEKRWMR